MLLLVEDVNFGECAGVVEQVGLRENAVTVVGVGEAEADAVVALQDLGAHDFWRISRPHQVVQRVVVSGLRMQELPLKLVVNLFLLLILVEE